ncbi:MAG: chorismate mutase [Planctomycetota bacterium]|jgi:chorismate mutase
MTLSLRRRKIDEIDGRILDLLARRMALAREIAALKTGENAPLRDMQREKAVIQRLRRKAVFAGLDDDFASEIFHRIMAHNFDIQCSQPTGVEEVSL